MKKCFSIPLLTLCMALFVALSLPFGLTTISAKAESPRYTVIGQTELTGADWDADSTENQMTLDETAGKYYKIYKNVAIGTYEFLISTQDTVYNTQGTTTLTGTKANVEVKTKNSTVIIGFTGSRASVEVVEPGKQILVGGVDLMQEDGDHIIKCGEGTAKYNASANALTLTNAQITGCTPDGQGAAGIYIYNSEDDFTIVLRGKNTISLPEAKKHNGIFMWGKQSKLTIESYPYETASLNILLGGNPNTTAITNSGGTIEFDRVNLSFEAAESSPLLGSICHSNEGIVFNRTKLTSAGGYRDGVSTSDSGTITIKNKTEIDLKTVEIGLYSGDITVTDSKIKAVTEDFAAICSWGNVSFTESSVHAETISDNGIYCYGKIRFSAGKATVISEENDALRANSGISVKDGADVTASAGLYTAVYTNENILVQDGTLTANGGEDGYAILAKRVVDLPVDVTPTEDKTTITLGTGMTANGGTIAVEDWVYEKAWDDMMQDYFDRWVAYSYFVDAEENVLQRVVISNGYTAATQATIENLTKKMVQAENNLQQAIATGESSVEEIEALQESISALQAAKTALEIKDTELDEKISSAQNSLQSAINTLSERMTKAENELKQINALQKDLNEELSATTVALIVVSSVLGVFTVFNTAHSTVILVRKYRRKPTNPTKKQ